VTGTRKPSPPTTRPGDPLTPQASGQFRVRLRARLLFYPHDRALLPFAWSCLLRRSTASVNSVSAHQVRHVPASYQTFTRRGYGREQPGVTTTNWIIAD
jgi:hypothetical protein